MKFCSLNNYWPTVIFVTLKQDSCEANWVAHIRLFRMNIDGEQDYISEATSQAIYNVFSHRLKQA